VKKIAIFASGEGSNAQQLIDHFNNSKKARVALVVSNNPNAFVLERAKKAGIPALIIDKHSFINTTEVVDKLQSLKIDLIVLAGFLWLIPPALIKAFPNRIVNIHPALLPKFGGKGMYGMNVHRAVCQAGEKETGITVHYVNEHYDSGEIILQERCMLEPGDAPEAVSAKVRRLEHEHFPRAVERVIDSLDKQ
jgi:phosphoribosylglycinamide formyltransferase 1